MPTGIVWLTRVHSWMLIQRALSHVCAGWAQQTASEGSNPLSVPRMEVSGAQLPRDGKNGMSLVARLPTFRVWIQTLP